jgi:hypothetical protein
MKEYCFERMNFNILSGHYVTNGSLLWTCNDINIKVNEKKLNSQITNSQK